MPISQLNKLLKPITLLLASLSLLLVSACAEAPEQKPQIKDATPMEILGNPEYQAFSFGGYRERTRDEVPSIAELKDDMKILQAMGIKVLRTYNTSQYAHAANLLKAIRELKNEDPSFEMYVMLGTWIEAQGSWTDSVNHNEGNYENNNDEISAAVRMVNEYPDIVKFIAVGNEAMVQWATSYFVRPHIILKWVNHLQELKKQGEIPADIMITSSDNFASWGGGDNNYHTHDLVALLNAVDFVSMHTYPYHDTHYNPVFWGSTIDESKLSKSERIDYSMQRALNYAKSQYQAVKDYMDSVGVDKPIHIGEIGWASVDNVHYGNDGAKASDEIKQKIFYDKVRQWTNEAGMTCWYFESFDEQWKDYKNPLGSENHFGLINLQNEAKYALWDLFDKGVFDGLTRNGKAITKTYGGDLNALRKDVEAPPLKSDMGILQLSAINIHLKTGEPIKQANYIVLHSGYRGLFDDATLPSKVIKLNPWEGTAKIQITPENVLKVTTGNQGWWGGALEVSDRAGKNLTNFKNGFLHFEIKGETSSPFQIGLQTGRLGDGSQVNNYVEFGPNAIRQLSNNWKSYAITIAELDKGADLTDVTAVLYLWHNQPADGKPIYLRNVFYSLQR